MSHPCKTPLGILAALGLLSFAALAQDQTTTGQQDQTTPAPATKDTKKPTDKKKDPDAIGDRDIGKGVNFYSLDKEIGLGKQMAQEVERQAHTAGVSHS